LGGGLISAAIGLLLIGTKLTAAPAESGITAGLRPNAAVMALGFLIFGGVLGLVAGAVLGRVLGNREKPRHDWLANFALVSVAAVAPLLFIGGLVTSTNSGMAVPDWPNTYGSNMLLYPLGPRADPGVYLEHSHRLFGVLVGLATLVLMTWALLLKRAAGSRSLRSSHLGWCVCRALSGASACWQTNAPSPWCTVCWLN
jgi:heme A synthase